MMANLSTRRYGAGLQPVGSAVEATARSTSIAVSGRCVAGSETAPAETLATNLSGLDLVALMPTACASPTTGVTALGISIDGTKHPLGVGKGDTENATVVEDLLVACATGASTPPSRSCACLDGAKALNTAVKLG